MRSKLIMSLSAVAAVLLLSSIISVMEYENMSTYVSDLIADDIRSINVARKLSDVSNNYNLEILAVIGDDANSEIPEFDDEYFYSHCDSLRASMASNIIKPLADSVVYSYSAYMLTSLELKDVLQSDFIDSRTWYFERLQPRFDRLRTDMDHLTSAIHADLASNSSNFDSGFYRSVMPGIVAVGVGLLLVVMLLIFMLAYYVNPVYKMLDGVKNYLGSGRKYSYEFDGNDQLSDLNDGISNLVNENLQLRERINRLRKKQVKPEGEQ